MIADHSKIYAGSILSFIFGLLNGLIMFAYCLLVPIIFIGAALSGFGGITNHLDLKTLGYFLQLIFVPALLFIAILMVIVAAYIHKLILQRLDFRIAVINYVLFTIGMAVILFLPYFSVRISKALTPTLQISGWA